MHVQWHHPRTAAITLRPCDKCSLHGSCEEMGFLQFSLHHLRLCNFFQFWLSRFLKKKNTVLLFSVAGAQLCYKVTFLKARTWLYLFMLAVFLHWYWLSLKARDVIKRVDYMTHRWIPSVWTLQNVSQRMWINDKNHLNILLVSCSKAKSGLEIASIAPVRVG